MKHTYYLFLFVLLIYSCGKDNPVVDGEDQTGFNQSIEKIRETLPTLQKDKLTEAIQLVYDYKTNSADGNRWAAVRNLLSEQNADQIFTLAEKLASENDINWHRNQAPYPGGLPKPETDQPAIEIVEATDRPKNLVIKDASSIDLSVEQNETSLNIYPTFLRQDGTILRFNKNVSNILVEIFSDNILVYSMRGNLDSFRDADPNFGGNGIVVPMSRLRKEKIKTNQLLIKTRVPHPEKYLTQRTKIAIPESYIGYKEKIDTVKKTKPDSIIMVEDTGGVLPEPLIEDLPKSKDESVSTLIAKRFIQNVKNNQLNKAYGLTKNPKWSSYKSFTSKETGFGEVKELSNINVKFVDLNNNQATFNVSYKAKNTDNIPTDYQYKYTLTKENERWFVTDSELVNKKVEQKTDLNLPIEKDSITTS